jgi:hypothetical protein
MENLAEWLRRSDAADSMPENHQIFLGADRSASVRKL